MATARRTREESRAETRARLLEAAARVFGLRGYHAASVEEVAEDAGFSTGALYSNFDGKEDLFLALLEREIEQRFRDVAAGAAGGPSVEDRARGAAGRWMAFLDREPEMVMLFMEFWSYAVRNPEMRARFAERYARVRTEIARLIEDGARELDVELTLPAEQIATAVDALADGIALQRLADPDAVPDDLLGTALSLLLEGARRGAPVAGAAR